MGLPGKCWYPMQAFRSGGPQALAAMLEDFFRSGWDPIVLGGIDGSNAHPNLAGGGLSWSGSSGSGGGGPYPPKPTPPPHLPAPWAKRLVVEMADETADAHIRKKGAPGTPENRKPGVEIVIDPSDTTYGKVCFVAKQDKSKQIGSVIVENPATVTNPKVDFFANYGKMRFGTSGAFDWEMVRNGTATLVDNGTQIRFSRKMDFATGLGSVAQITGPTDQPLTVESGSGADLYLYAASGRNLYLDSPNNNIFMGRSTNANTVATFGSAGHIKFTSAGPTVAADVGVARVSAGVAKTSNGSTGFGDHALSDVLGYGAATSFRTKMDFGTPSADKTITIPNRDLTMVGRAAAGTNNKLIRFDSNGDAQDSGAEDDGTTISTARKVSVTGLFSATAGNVSGVNEEDLAANKTLVETSPTFQHLKSGAARDVNLPATPTTGLLFHIHNYGSAAADLTVKTSSGTTLATLADGEWSWFQHVGGNSWQAWGLF